jgi:hypothetical protein
VIIPKKEEHRVRIYEDTILEKKYIGGLTQEELWDNGENYVDKNFIIYTLHQMLLGLLHPLGLALAVHVVRIGS